MNFKYLLLFTSLLFSLSAFGEGKINRPILFSLTKDGQTSYILGTFHLGINFSELPDSVVAKIKSRPVFMSEAGLLGEQEGPAPSYDKAPPLKPETVGKLQQRGLPPPLITLLETKPGLGCMFYLYTEWFTESSRIQTFDEQIFKFAKRENKILLDLDDPSVEDISQPINLCDVNLLASEETPEQAKAEFAADRANYRNGVMPEKLNAKNDELLQVTARNTKWLSKITSAHKLGAFIIMGDGHLGGEQGVLKGLERLGFEITRLEN